ncbi:hypothetical protein CPC08DRAFT_176087 [Agrocybe pediades]|nr:hypothetical protein CPC08DRAFT_176087 [Agrocybe pediades]
MIVSWGWKTIFVLAGAEPPNILFTPTSLESLSAARCSSTKVKFGTSDTDQMPTGRRYGEWSTNVTYAGGDSVNLEHEVGRTFSLSLPDFILPVCCSSFGQLRPPHCPRQVNPCLLRPMHNKGSHSGAGSPSHPTIRAQSAMTMRLTPPLTST